LDDGFYTVDKDRGREEDCIEEVAGQDEMPNLQERFQRPHLNLLPKRILASGIFVDDSEFPELLEVVEGYAWAGQGKSPLCLPYPYGSGALEKVPVDPKRRPMNLAFLRRLRCLIFQA